MSIRFNHSTEFGNSNIEAFCAKNGINHTFSAPRIPQQNVVERKNRNLVDIAITMFIDLGLAMSFWAE